MVRMRLWVLVFQFQGLSLQRIYDNALKQEKKNGEKL